MRVALIQVGEMTSRLVWSVDHLLLDGWSSSLILKDLFESYQTLREGRELHSQASRPYGDYIQWLQHQDLCAAEQYFRQALCGVTAPTPLGVDRAQDRGHIEIEPYGELQAHLSAATTAALKAFAQQQRVTLNTLMRGAWALLLSRYSGDEDVILGATVSGRPPHLDGVEEMVGLFINTLPVRVQVPPAQTLEPWLKQLQAQQQELLQFEYAPLVDIQGWSDVPRGLPLFESLLVFENYPWDTAWHQDSSLGVSDPCWFNRTHYPLTVMATAREEMWLRITFDRRRFEAGTVERLLGHMLALLEAMLAGAHQKLSDLPVLTAAERQQLLVEWNATQAGYPRELGLHELVEAQVSRTPEAPAVTFGEETLTYAELNRRANHLARVLQAHGVRPDKIVGVCIERSLDLVIGVLAILKAGGAYLPLDPSYPVERLRWMLADARAPILLTQSSLEAKLTALPAETLPDVTGSGGRPGDLATAEAVQVLCMDRLPSAEGPAPNLGVSVTPDHLAYVIYTSGSTGTPKGIALPQRALRNLLAWHARTIPGAVRTLQFASISFDVSFYELFSAWQAGGCVVLASEESRRDPGALTALLLRERVEKAILPVAMLPLLAQCWPEDEPGALRDVIATGEALQISPEVRDWLASLPGSRLHNHYGPSETHVVTAAVLTGRPEEWPALPPIGVPISNSTAYVLNAAGQPVPVGVKGELYLGGEGVARGYIHRPDWTAERFLPDPFHVMPGSRMYRTGDLARYLPDGTLEFLGRRDHQVKIRGFRIELGEIETALQRHRGVREAVVLARDDHRGEKRLVAYVVGGPAERVNGSELRGFLQERLPEYMVPTTFVLLESLPLTPNGKVDRRALPVPDAGRPQDAGIYVAPRTPVEEVLAGTMGEVLGLERVGVHDSFFALGGHSLLATQVISRVRGAFQCELPVRALFETPTVEGLSRVLVDKWGSSEVVEEIARTIQSVSQLPDEAIGKLLAKNGDEADETRR
jgi:amino acid adenylation domain-containing protein